jgi:hypothetical protein
VVFPQMRAQFHFFIVSSFSGIAFAPYRPTDECASDVDCFHDLDGAIARAAGDLRRPAAR